MGTTSTRPSLSELQAEYAALENKKSKRGFALRKAIKAAKAQAPDLTLAPEGLDVTPSEVASPPPKMPTSTGDDGVLPDLRILETREKTAVYWCGVIPGDRNSKTAEGWPPCHQIDGIGGRTTFVEYWTPFEGVGQDGSPRRGEYPGMLVELSESQVAQIRRGLRTSVVRWRTREGRHRHGYVVHIPGTDDIDELKRTFGLNEREVARLRVKAEQFQIRPGDEPVARYIYCMKVTGPEAKAGAKWRPSTTLPPSVEQVGSIEGP